MTSDAMHAAMVEAARLGALAALREAGLVGGGAGGAVYDRTHLPPGATSWRQVLDAHRAGRLVASRVGRAVVVTAEAWRAYLEKHPAKRAPRKAPPKAAPMTSQEALRAALPGRGRRAA